MTAHSQTGSSGRVTVPTIRLAIIATGARSEVVVSHLLRDRGHIAITAVYDPDRARARKALARWQSPGTEICETYQEAIRRDDVDWVLVFSPNAHHRAHILCAFEAGKHVFSEKPLATSIADCQEIFARHHHSGLRFMTGFVLRYAPLYRKVQALLKEGFVGRIISIDANENIAPAHGAYIMSNWRRLKALAGPHILEKCCHDLDLLNWFCGSLPSRVAAFGGRDLFTPENAALNEQLKGAFAPWQDPANEPCPFRSEKDLMDNQVAILQYRNGIRVMFQATMANAIPERRMYISGTEGTLIAELYSGSLRAKRLDQEEVRLYDFSIKGDGHGGGDAHIAEELHTTMVHGTEPRSSGVEGLESAVVALAIDEACEQGGVFDLEPVWRTLGR